MTHLIGSFERSIVGCHGCQAERSLPSNSTIASLGGRPGTACVLALGGGTNVGRGRRRSLCLYFGFVGGAGALAVGSAAKVGRENKRARNKGAKRYINFLLAPLAGQASIAASIACFFANSPNASSRRGKPWNTK